MNLCIAHASSIAIGLANLAADPSSGDHCAAVAVVIGDDANADDEDVLDAVHGVAAVLGYAPFCIHLQAPSPDDAAVAGGMQPWQQHASRRSHPLIIASINQDVDPGLLRGFVTAVRNGSRDVIPAEVVIVMQRRPNTDAVIEAIADGVLDAGKENVHVVEI